MGSGHSTYPGGYQRGKERMASQAEGLTVFGGSFAKEGKIMCQVLQWSALFFLPVLLS